MAACLVLSMRLLRTEAFVLRPVNAAGLHLSGAPSRTQVGHELRSSLTPLASRGSVDMTAFVQLK